MTDSKTTDLDTVSEKSQEAPVQQAAQTPAAETEKKPAVRTTRAAAGRKTAAKTAAKTTKPAAKSAAKPAARRSSSRKAAAVEVDGKVDLTEPSLYTNREISWIEFDRKVLETAIDPSVPLLERVKFLSIFFNNLDEFYMVRVMNLQRQARSGVAPTGADKMPPAKQLSEIRRRVCEMLDIAENLWLKDLRPALDKKGVRFVSYEALPPKQRVILDKYFETEIFPDRKSVV